MGAVVYVLVDPETHKPFYVGSTINLEQRIKQHVYTCNVPLNVSFTATQLRIQEIVRSGKLPIVTVVEETTEDEREKMEGFWIKNLLEQGVQLTNRVAAWGNRPLKEVRSELGMPETALSATSSGTRYWFVCLKCFRVGTYFIRSDGTSKSNNQHKSHESQVVRGFTTEKAANAKRLEAISAAARYQIGSTISVDDAPELVGKIVDIWWDGRQFIYYFKTEGMYRATYRTPEYRVIVKASLDSK